MATYELRLTVGGVQAPVRVPIEPLVGPLRDPRVCTNYGQFLLSRHYIVSSDWAAHNVGPQVCAFSLGLDLHYCARQLLGVE